MIGLVLKYKGNRWNVPGNAELHWTIAYVMDLMSNELPSFKNNEVEVLYLRTVVTEKDWSTTTLAQLFGLSKTATGNYCILLQPAKTTSKQSSSSSSSEEAIQVLLQNNFDDDSITCLITICKLVDNVLKSSLDDMSKRTLKSSNKILQQKIFSKVGGLDLITSLGFISNDGVIYTLEKPNITFLLQTRIHIQQTLRQTLHCPTDQLPSSQPPSIPPPPKKQQPPSNDFNPYVTQNYNTQKGGSNPVLANTNVSTTERHLQLLQSKQSKLEQQIQLTDRQIIAFPPSTTVTTTHKEETNVKSKSDGSLIAARMKKMEDDRKKREEGGFTTKAMRDLEKMKKAKVYSHVQLRICFPDGSYLTAKFLPRETIQMVKDVIQSCFSVPNLDFDLYVAPPRRMLQLKNTLSTEGLVPAAKVHVSWKVTGSPLPNTTFLQPHLFQEQYQQQTVFPNAKPIVDERKQQQQQQTNKRAAAGGNNRQDALLRKMMGKPTSLLRGNNTNNKKSADGSSKPKWFKP